MGISLISVGVLCGRYRADIRSQTLQRGARRVFLMRHQILIEAAIGRWDRLAKAYGLRGLRILALDHYDRRRSYLRRRSGGIKWVFGDYQGEDDCDTSERRRGRERKLRG